MSATTYKPDHSTVNYITFFDNMEPTNTISQDLTYDPSYYRFDNIDITLFNNIVFVSTTSSNIKLN